MKRLFSDKNHDIGGKYDAVIFLAARHRRFRARFQASLFLVSWVFLFRLWGLVGGFLDGVV